MVAMKATTKAVCAAIAAAVLGACSHAPAPQAYTAPQGSAPATFATPNTAALRAEMREGVRSYKLHAYKNALAHFNSALAIDANNTDALYDRAVTEERVRAFGHSESDLRDLVRARPHWAPARLHLAAAQYRSHDFNGAAANFDIVVREEPKAWRIWLDDGAAYYHLHRYADARKRFARALDLAPRSGRAHYWLGLAYRHLSQPSKAREELALAAHSRDRGVRDSARRVLR